VAALVAARLRIVLLAARAGHFSLDVSLNSALSYT
jgi:hypothetical protein